MKFGGSTAWRSITQPISSRSLSDASADLRHIDLAHGYSRAILDNHPRDLPAPARENHRACPPCLQASQRQIALLDEGIWTSLSKRICLHLAGTAFGLLGVLLEGPFGNRHRFPYQEPSHKRSQAVLRLNSGRPLARGPCPQVLQRHPGVAKGTFIDPLARGPSTEPLLGQGHVARLSGTGVKPVSCRCFGRTSARHPRREASRWHLPVAKRVF